MEQKYNLQRFIAAQEDSYEVALYEIESGEKQSHWMWYIFPQIKGLGMSSTSEYYGIDGIEEAEEYMKHPVLRARLLEISEALLEWPGKTAQEIFGYVDAMKLKSSMTLFHLACPEEEIFEQILEIFFDLRIDEQTLELIRREANERC